METTKVIPRGSKNTSILGKIYSECKIFSSIIFILDKLESDGYFERINECLQFIFNKEMAFAVFELKKIKSRKKKFDIKNQLVNNTFIFKENLKIITGSLIDTLWNEKVRTEKIQQTIQKAQQEINKGTFEEIIEMEEEEENYLSSDLISRRETPTVKPKVQAEEDFAHSYETDLESKEFKFGSGGANPRKGAGEDQAYELENLSEKNSKGAEAGVESNSNGKKDVRDFGTFGDPINEMKKKKIEMSPIKVKNKRSQNDWKNDFEIETEKESIDQEIQKMKKKDIVTCQSMGNKWDLKPWEQRSNGEKPRTSASMGSLTLKSNHNGTSQDKGESKENEDNAEKENKNEWKRGSGMNMYLLSRKHGSSNGSSMRSVSKSGSLRLENSNGAKSESLKRKRENEGWLQEEMQKGIMKRTLADRLSEQKQRQIRGAVRNKKTYKKFPTGMYKKVGMSMTPEISVKKRNHRVSSLTKLKRLKNHLMTNPEKGYHESDRNHKNLKRKRMSKNRSPQQMVKKIISGVEKSSRLNKKNSLKVY